MDKTWIKHFTLESNRLSAEWTPEMQISAGKVLASVFWDAQGIFFFDYLEKGRTINNKYYIALLVHLKEEIAKKQPQMQKKIMLFHQDNAPCHKSITMMAKLHELHFELHLLPPYSPDLAPRDHQLFADLKRMLQEKRFGSNEEVISGGVFWGQKQIILQIRHWIVRETLESMYHARRWLLMNKVEFCLNVVLLVRSRSY